jgi:hypothetical protein
MVPPGWFRLFSGCRPAPGDLSAAVLARGVDLASLGGHRVVRQEFRHRSSDGLGTLDVQEMADTLDGAVLDLREPGVEQGPTFDEQLHRLGAEDREDRLENGGRLLGPNAQALMVRSRPVHVRA